MLDAVIFTNSHVRPAFGGTETHRMGYTIDAESPLPHFRDEAAQIARVNLSHGVHPKKGMGDYSDNGEEVEFTRKTLAEIARDRCGFVNLEDVANGYVGRYSTIDQMVPWVAPGASKLRAYILAYNAMVERFSETYRNAAPNRNARVFSDLHFEFQHYDKLHGPNADKDVIDDYRYAKGLIRNLRGVDMFLTQISGRTDSPWEIVGEKLLEEIREDYREDRIPRGVVGSPFQRIAGASGSFLDKRRIVDPFDLAEQADQCFGAGAQAYGFWIGANINNVPNIHDIVARAFDPVLEVMVKKYGYTIKDAV